MDDLLHILQHKTQSQSKLSIQEQENPFAIEYKGSICAPSCSPIGSLNSRESLVLTNSLRLISLIFDTLKSSSSESLRVCSKETLYEFLEYMPSEKNDRENPVFEAIAERMV